MVSNGPRQIMFLSPCTASMWTDIVRCTAPCHEISTSNVRALQEQRKCCGAKNAGFSENDSIVHVFQGRTVTSNSSTIYNTDRSTRLWLKSKKARTITLNAYINNADGRRKKAGGACFPCIDDSEVKISNGLQTRLIALTQETYRGMCCQSDQQLSSCVLSR